MRIRSSASSLVALLALAAAAPAAAAPGELALTEVFDGTLTPAAGTTAQACQAAYRPGTPGVATREVRTPAGLALVTARLSGGAEDLDLAIFDGAGAAIAGGASPDAQEVAEGWTAQGGALRIQVCRRDGDDGAGTVVVERAAVAADAAAAVKTDPPQLVDVLAPTRAERSRVANMGLDLTEHAGRTSVGVVLHGAADRAKLTRAGLKWDVVVPDLVAQDVAARRAERTAGVRTASRAALPSGRTGTYRTLTDYENELKDLAAKNPGLVKLVILRNKTLGGRDVLGVEITENVNVADGKPGFLNMGVHHAREWPAGENAMEWAYELVNGFKAGDPRIAGIVRRSRNYVVPIVNPDGFNASRTAGAVGGADGGRNEAVPDTAYIVAGASTGGEYRRKNCRVPGTETAVCVPSPGVRETGVDPNRNYGGLWGGPGASTDLSAQDFRGEGPFSEKETQNIKELVGSTQIMSLITNHTTAGLLLRAPGLASLGEPADEERGYKALGDAMAKENGYFSQSSFELYDTTGGTEDWTYNTAGGFGFTFEIYCGAPNYSTGDCDDPAFHPSYARVIEEYEGTSPQADHKTDPGRSATSPFGNVKGFDGGGNREAYKLAAESAIDEARHSVLAGTAPGDATLRVKKTFKTRTFPGATPAEFDDQLESTLAVGPSGTFTWHVNPSTRPIVAERGLRDPGTASPPITQAGGTAGAAGEAGGDGARPVADQLGTGVPPVASANYNDHPFTIPANAANRSANVDVTWATTDSDWDIELYADDNANGKSDADETVIASSGQGGTTSETLAIPRAALVAGQKLVLRVVNFNATESYAVTVRFAAGAPFQAGTVEAWTLTCERAGQVVTSQQVVVDRGGAVRGLTPCATTRGGGGGSGSGSGSGPGTTTTTKTTAGCVAGGGFGTVGITPRGRGARFTFTRKISAKATISVFQQSSGRTVTGERLVARFTGRTGAFTWNGRATQRKRTVADGFYFARYDIGSGRVKDTRRVVLERRNGRFVKRPDFYRRATCDALPSFKLERPVFGGRTNRPLNVSVRLADAGRATVRVLRGTRVVKTFTVTSTKANATRRLTLAAGKLARGAYTVRISVPRPGTSALTATLTARRL